MRRLLHAIWRLITAPFRWIGQGMLWILKRSPFKEFLTEEPEDIPLLDTLRKATDDPKEFLLALIEHLDALRSHLLRSVVALLIASIISLYYIERILDWITTPIGGMESLQAIAVTEPISVAMGVSLLAGFAISLPYICFELLRFIAPGISQRARWIGLVGTPLVFIFFIGGILFTYYVILPAAIPTLINFLGFNTIPTPKSYIKFIAGLMFWIGVSFELPLITFLLSAMGLLPPNWLREQWRLVVVILTIFAAMITPTVDPINMMIVLLPLLLLYLLSIFTAQLGQGLRKRKKTDVE